ncbi:nodulation protein NodH [Tropicimonas sp. TH_r6]|uniref:nodulation protein NodH n=1 Tax=Tropicimonas sp. TH_r6 TaxID=3082085 RepID=UPI00295563E6|nr:nodulation protein NodH [Tropicimonas sp. TH_r6]MDV7145126.1 nodulation protein NodH [Tropicimonas sp. TH_r6]
MAEFDGFVLLAEMRTGSNFLEETLNLCPGLTCHGEAFNPAFLGHHDGTELFGMKLAERDADPLELMKRIFARTDGLGGFRLFHDHEPAVLEAILPDPRIAKIHLSRNPLESYVSRKIATATGQWRLTNERHRKSQKIRFEPGEFAEMVQGLRAHQARVSRALKLSGQTAFALSFEEAGDVEILNGLLRFLGLEERLPAVSDRLKRQNPAALSDKVENFEEMRAALAGMDLAGLVQSPGEAEPRHDATVPSFVAAPHSPLLFMPVKGGPNAAIETWLGQLDGDQTLQRGFTRKSLRQWKNRNKGGRSFTVVCHPLERAYAVFERYILDCGPGGFLAIRRHLRADLGLPIPEEKPDANYGSSERRTAFLGYLDFVKKTLAGQTNQRSDPAFSSQATLVQSLSEVFTPDMVIRIDQLPLGLRQVFRQAGLSDPPPVPKAVMPGRARLAEIHDADLEMAARTVYNRDYMAFGFKRWKA